MRFTKKKNKRYLDLDGNLILSRNASPVSANVGSAVPTLHNGLIIHLPKANKFRALWIALRFIWGVEALKFGLLLALCAVWGWLLWL